MIPEQFMKEDGTPDLDAMTLSYKDMEKQFHEKRVSPKAMPTMEEDMAMEASAPMEDPMMSDMGPGMGFNNENHAMEADLRRGMEMLGMDEPGVVDEVMPQYEEQLGKLRSSRELYSLVPDEANEGFKVPLGEARHKDPVNVMEISSMFSAEDPVVGARPAYDDPEAVIPERASEVTFVDNEDIAIAMKNPDIVEVVSVMTLNGKAVFIQPVLKDFDDMMKSEAVNLITSTLDMIKGQGAEPRSMLLSGAEFAKLAKNKR